LQGSSGSCSATVTVQLNITETKFNWCAYVSDYPPNVTLDKGTYTFKGTPPFTLIASDGITTQTVSGTTFPISALTIMPTTIRDKTGCPGILCPYQENDLFIDASHLCQQRTSGAQNWEAWIKDTRDNELYRIVFMPDNKWWLAETMRYDASNTQQSYKCPNDAQHTIYNYPSVACPAGWTLPSVADYNDLFTTVTLAPLKATGVCNGNDYYGYSLTSDQYNSNVNNADYPKGSCDREQPWVFMVQTSDQLRLHVFYAGDFVMGCDRWGPTNSYSWNEARCHRQL
jgi:uncharacterized protein (TIGR02145 family)